MAKQSDVRRIALALPGVTEAQDRFAFSVTAPAKGKGKGKPKERGFLWVWMERVDPKKARVPQPKVLVVRTADLAEKEMLLGMEGDKLFTEPHYHGYPAVLVRLERVTVKELRELIETSWRANGGAGEAKKKKEKETKMAKMAKKEPPGRSRR